MRSCGWRVAVSPEGAKSADERGCQCGNREGTIVVIALRGSSPSACFEADRVVPVINERKPWQGGERMTGLLFRDISA